MLGRSVGDLRMRSVGLAVSDVGDRDALAGVMLAKRGEQLLDTGDLLAADRRQDVARADASLRGGPSGARAYTSTPPTVTCSSRAISEVSCAGCRPR